MHNKDARFRFKVPPQLKVRRSRRRWLAVAAAVAVAATLVYPLTTGAAQQDLTASFSNVPDTHNGSPFTFDLTFDPEPSLSYRTLKDHSFTVENGEVTRAERYQKRPAKNLRWKIRVVPDSATQDVTITLPVTTSCSDQGAICTSGNLMLSNSNTVTVAAAVISPPPDDSEQLTAEFSDVPAAQNGSDFTFKVTFTPEPVLRADRMRKHVFTVSNAKITKALRDKRGSSAAWTIKVRPHLDDNENPAGDITITLPPTETCPQSKQNKAAVCTSDNVKLTEAVTATVPVSTDPARPGQPQDVAATPGPDIGEITLSWTEAQVGSEANAAVRGYRVRYNCAEAKVARLGPNARSFKIGGLNRSSNCRINVAARNDNGYSDSAWAGSSTTDHQPLNPPEAPGSVTVVPVDANDDSMGSTVTWTAPASGDEPTSYQIAYWDIDEERFQYATHASTTDLEAVIDVPAADLRTVAVRGHLEGVAYEDQGVWGAWETGWHSSATQSNLDKMAQSDTLSLTLTHSDDDTAGMAIDFPEDAMCRRGVGGVYVQPYTAIVGGVETNKERAWITDPCSARVHAYDIASSDGALTYDADTSLMTSELYPEGGIGSPSGLSFYDPMYTPSTLWSDGETLWVGEKDRGFLLPYRLSDGSFQRDDRFVMIPLPSDQMVPSALGPSAVWSDGDTAWVADDMISGLIFAVSLNDDGPWRRTPEELFVPSAFDSCYIPEHPMMGDVTRAATCSDQTVLRTVINSRYDEVVGLHSDGRWLWIAVDFNEEDAAGKLLAFNLLTGERAASRDITLHSDITTPAGIWSDGDSLWVTDSHTGRLYTFSIPTG